MKTLRATIAAVALLAGTSVLSAQSTRPITARDLWQLKRVGAPVASPDGSRAAFVVTTYDIEENKGNADIHVLGVTGEPVQLTTSPANDNSPVWSPDGRRLAFVSARAGTAAQLFVIAADGGEARQVTTLPVAVSAPAWFPDGRRIAFVAHVPPDFAGDFAALKQQLDERAKRKVTAHVTEHRQYRYWDRWLTDGDYPRIFAVDVETGAVTDLMPGSSTWFNFDGAQYSIAPDGRELAVSANTTLPPYDSLNLDILLLSTDGSGATRNITATNAASDFRPIYSPDGRSIVYGEQRERHYYADRVRLVRYDRATGQRTVLTEELDLTPEQWVFARDGRVLYFHAENRAGKPLYALAYPGGAVREVYRGGTNDGVAVLRDRLLVLHQSLSLPPTIHEVMPNGSGFQARTRFNDALLAQLRFGRVENVTYRGANGADIQMFVLYPPDFDPAQQWPLVLQIHGGPHGTFGDVFHFRWNSQVFAAPGYVIAMPNFHGSTSFGAAFTRSIHGDWAEKPFADIMAATDYMVGRGFIDERRMAATGGSYGGYMVSWIAGATDRFAALINHAGVANVQMQWASDGDFLHSIGGSLWLRPEVMQRNNPIQRAANFRTPMLIIHGARDYRVPSDQALELYGIYRARGLAARLVFYPDENHWILSPQNSLHWYGEFLGWLDRYLKPDGARVSER